MDCVIITTGHLAEEFANYDNVLKFIKDYKNFKLP
jgi:hypothetical protein